MDAPLNASYLRAGTDIRSWLLSVDHKRIAILYLVTITVLYAIGGFAALLVRLELLDPGPSLIGSDTYNRAFTIHGIVMVFFFLIPAIPTVFGNFLLPLMLGARDLAFPRLNLASWYVFVFGSALMLFALFFGGVDTGWTFYTPFSTVYSNGYVVLTAVAVFIAGFSSIFTAINFIVTIHRLRTPGLTWFRLPLFVWAIYATSLIIVLGTPVVAMTLLFVAAERLFGIGIFDPKLGGDPILYQHLFWFYSHPAVYIMFLPGAGVVSETIAAFTGRGIFGYKSVAIASLGIAIYGFFVWGHHMFTSGQSIYASIVFSFMSMLVAIPSAIKVFNWTTSLYRGSVTISAPMLYALSFIGLFTIGGLTGVFVASTGFDLHVHDTYFVVAHFHYIMVGGTMSAYLGALHFWWPKMTGRLYSRTWALIAAGLLFIGFNLTFFPQFLLGYGGMPRRYHVYPAEYQIWHVLSTAGSTILGVGYLLPFTYLFWSWIRGERAQRNPWGANGLEWETESPPPPENFEQQLIIEGEPYRYKITRVDYEHE